MLSRLTLTILTCGALFAQKRPITHQDYDAWRNIRSQQLSHDGKFLAYALFPQEGDGEFVVRNLTTGKEWHESAGQTPPPPRPDPNAPEEGPPQARGITIAFTHDSKYVVFSTFPPDAEVQKAKRAKKKADEMPKNGLAIMDLATGAVKKIDRVKSFHVPEDGGDMVAWLAETNKASEKTSPLTIRNLATGNDRKIDGVSEFILSKDGKSLVYLAETVSAIDPNGDAQPASLLPAGKYSKLTWDDKQSQVAFFGDGGRLILWTRNNPAASVVASADTAGLKKGFAISDRGSIAFSKDGQRIFFGCAPARTPVKRDDTPDDDKVSVDLWHWKDDYIQPMQKVRAAADRNRTYRAVYSIAEKKLLQVADDEMADVTPSEDGRWAIGGDDRAYRAMQEYDERYRDSYIVDLSDGSRKMLAKKHVGNLAWSPDGKYALMFDGHDWNTISIQDRKTVNLTSNLGVRFWNEEHDTPGRPSAYGPAAWTKDGKWILANDHFDIWQIAPDGSVAKNLTAGYGRKNHLMFRYVRLDEDQSAAGPGGRGGGGGRAGGERTVDPSKPLLLRVENNDTHDTGFFRTTIGATDAPQKLILGPKSYGNPIKAKDADVLVLTESTFEEFPDLQLTDMNFKELRKVSDANPQKSKLLWGTTELVHFRNADGVPLNATLYKPENFDPKKKYPMIVYIYERLSQNVNTFVEPRPTHNINPTYYVSNGYLILEPDIVYTTGQPGQSALKCVLPAVQEMVDRGYVDENAIGIQGHSWGGYQIAYMITQTSRFRAVAAGAPVSNMTSAYDGIRWGPGIPRQFQYERTQSRIGGSLWEYPMRFIENSPVFQADRIKTPIMMIHNDADDAVPWYQGIEFYLALRRLGKEAYLFTYNGEPHGLRRRPNQKDYTVRLQQYFDYFLKGAPKPDWMVHGIPYLESHPNAARGATETESQ